MVYVPHLRLSLIGDLPDGEMFSCNLSLRQENQTTQDFLDRWSGNDYATDSIAANNFNDLSTDCTNFWSSVGAFISLHAVLRRIKLAPIGADGHYVGAPLEKAVNTPGASDSEMHPFQIARKVTFETDGDIGRIKGGFYLPGVTKDGFDPTTNLTSTAYQGPIQAAVAAFVTNLNDAPGLDATGSFTVVVASQGRHRNGVQVVAPNNWDVKRVNVGRRLDVQRRRANKISEARTADTAVS